MKTRVCLKYFVDGCRRRTKKYNGVASVGPCAEKFNMLSNDHGRTQKRNFSVLDQKYPFWVNLVQEIKIASVS